MSFFPRIHSPKQIKYSEKKIEITSVRLPIQQTVMRGTLRLKDRAETDTYIN